MYVHLYCLNLISLLVPGNDSCTTYMYIIAVPYLFISLHTVQGIIYFIVHEKINIVKGRIEYLRKTALDRE